MLDNGPSEAPLRINTTIPEVFRESWICDIIAFDITEGKPAARVVEKDRFRLVHHRPSTVNTIFFGADNRTYLIEAAHTADNHPLGLLPPAILKK